VTDPGDSFKTIAKRSRSEIKIKRSRFIATVDHADCVDRANEIVTQISREFHDASHNCFAYRLGMGPSAQFRYSDDGEPSGTAGRPIMESVDKYGLTDLVLIVTRYYGGVKLGTGGLGRAYRDAAVQVLEKAGSVMRYVKTRLKLTFPLKFTTPVLRTLSVDGCWTVDSSYSNVGTVTIDVRDSRRESIEGALISVTSGRIRIEQAVGDKD
jgi:uncharacterized YigZ family protein